MSKQLFANEKVMKQYLTALLNEDDPNLNSANLDPVAKLLQQVPLITEKEESEQKRLETIEVLSSVNQVIDDNKQSEAQIINDSAVPPVKSYQDDYRNGEFQALFFNVAGLTLAVPLKSLGGIHQLGEINSIFGKPDWFKGVMLHREEKLSVIDTAKWVMPEKYDKTLKEALNYQYLIMLGDSHWGLLAENLVNNITLKNDDVKWREHSGKRPWLAGLIKEKMCALVDVTSLIELLEKGLDSQD